MWLSAAAGMTGWSSITRIIQPQIACWAPAPLAQAASRKRSSSCKGGNSSLPLPERGGGILRLAADWRTSYKKSVTPGRTVRLRLTWTAPDLLVAVEDDGAGFEPGGDSPRGNGLRNQAARMQEIGGSVEIKSAPGQGTQVTLRVSLPPE